MFMNILKGVFSLILVTMLVLAFGCQNEWQQVGGRVESRLNNFTDWATYRGDKKSTQYSTLDQITPQNVSELEEVWTYDTRNLVRPGMESNPINIDGIMYFADPELNFVALDAALGEE